MDLQRLRNLNKRLLQMQYLSTKASGPSSAVTVSEACCGINSQDFRESFSSFWARIDGFNDSHLLSELRPKGGLVRTWTIRGTMHTFPSKDYYVHVSGSPRKGSSRAMTDTQSDSEFPHEILGSRTSMNRC